MRLPRFNLMYVSIPSSHIITFILNSILNMAEYQCPWFHFEDDDHMKNKEMTIHHHGKSTPSSLSSSSIGEDSSMNSNGSSSCISSSDTKDDASSSSSSNGALYDLSDIMAHLPIKRGLSKFYQGKSESFALLSSVSSLEDLAKKPICRRNDLMKASRSCGNGLNNSYKRYTLPKALISKKPPSSSRAHFAVSSLSSRRVGFIDTKPSLAENFEC